MVAKFDDFAVLVGEGIHRGAKKCDFADSFGVVAGVAFTSGDDVKGRFVAGV